MWTFPWVKTHRHQQPMGLTHVVDSWRPKAMVRTGASAPAAALAAARRRQSAGKTGSSSSKHRGTAVHEKAFGYTEGIPSGGAASGGGSTGAASAGAGAGRRTAHTTEASRVTDYLHALGLSRVDAEVLVVAPDMMVATFVDAVVQDKSQHGTKEVTLLELKTGAAGMEVDTRSKLALPLAHLSDTGAHLAHAQLAATMWMFNASRPGGLVATKALLVSSGRDGVLATPCLHPMLRTDPATRDHWGQVELVGRCLVQGRPTQVSPDRLLGAQAARRGALGVQWARD